MVDFVFCTGAFWGGSGAGARIPGRVAAAEVAEGAEIFADRSMLTPIRLPSRMPGQFEDLRGTMGRRQRGIRAAVPLSVVAGATAAAAQAAAIRPTSYRAGYFR